MMTTSIRIGLAWVAFVTGSTMGLAQGPTQQELNDAAGNSTDWLITNHDYGGQRFVDLDLITRENVASLQTLCTYETDDRGPFHTHPLIYDGVMFLTVSLATVAIDATDCSEIWRHEWEPKAQRNFPMHRGVAIKDGKVVRGTLDGYLLAFDAASGRLLWEVAAPVTSSFLMRVTARSSGGMTRELRTMEASPPTRSTASSTLP